MVEPINQAVGAVRGVLLQFREGLRLRLTKNIKRYAQGSYIWLVQSRDKKRDYFQLVPLVYFEANKWFEEGLQ